MVLVTNVKSCVDLIGRKRVEMIIGLLVTIGLVVLSFKLCGLCLKICGKLLGGIFSIIGYLLIGILAVAGFGIAVVVIPIILVIGIATIVGWAAAL